VGRRGRRSRDAARQAHLLNLGHGLLPGNRSRILTDLVSLVTRYGCRRPPSVLSAAGISGLTAAYRIRLAAGERKIRCSSGDRLGGVLRTGEVGGGPDGLGAEALVYAAPRVPACWPEWAGGYATRHHRRASADL